MESLITEPGPKNPLLFLSLSLVNRIPGYTPDDRETLNQLECMNDLIQSVPISLFTLESVLVSCSVAIDSLLTISGIEAKKSIPVRVSSLECLQLLLSKMSPVNLIDVLPGVLSKLVKTCSNRVDVEIERITQISLQIVEIVVRVFWASQEEWKLSSEPKLNEEKFIILRQKYRNNVEMAICSLRPLIKSQERIDSFKETILNIFTIHLDGYQDQVSNSFLKNYLLLLPKAGAVISRLNSKRLIQFYNTEILDWFDVNSEVLSTIHEDILNEKLEIIYSLMILNNKMGDCFLLTSDVFDIYKRLTELKKFTLNLGETVSIEYSNNANFGIQNVFDNKAAPRTILDNEQIPEINFKKSLKLSKETVNLLFKIFAELIQKDNEALATLILNINCSGNINDSDSELLIQKLEMTAFYYSYGPDCCSLELLKDSLKYYELSIVEGGWSHELIHLATLKVSWSIFKKKQFDFRPILLIILSGMASDWIILREISTQILNGISKHFNETLKQFVGRNEIFLLDRLGIQLSLPALYPKAPQLISCLIRQVLDPEMALKFTDLLVKKVVENLTNYQKHSNYCKDLIEVVCETVKIVSRNERSLEFVDPKDYAFTKEPSNREENNPSCQQRIIIDLLKIGINFILSDSKVIRSKSIGLIEICTINFLKYEKEVEKGNAEPSSLCQLIHLAWPNMIAVLKDSTTGSSIGQLDLLVIESFASSCKVLFEKLPLFMRDRFVKDYWRCFLSNFNMKKGLMTPHNSSLKKLSNLLLETLNYGLIKCKPTTEICLQVLEFVKLNWCDFNALFVITLEILSKLEPDIIWYFYFIECGELKELTCSNCDELKSFRLDSTKQFNNPSIKDKVKTFIQ